MNCAECNESLCEFLLSIGLALIFRFDVRVLHALLVCRFDHL
jgi:hypothetical protein